MTGTRQRRCYEAGHRPKLLVVVDGTEEARRALYFAARRAKRTGARVVLLGLNAPGEYAHWFNVGNLMREEAEDQIHAVLTEAAGPAREITGTDPEQVVRTGAAADEIRALVDEDEDIALLVLAAGTGGEGPGPLVSTLAGRQAGSFPIPLMVVPGHLTEAEIDAVA